MFKGVIISESLNDPALLNNLVHTGVYVATGQDTPGVPVWHLFKVIVDDQKIETIRRNTAETIKYGWYAHFWNGETVFVCLKDRIFQLPEKTLCSSPEFQAMKTYAVSHGVEERYLDLDLS